MTAINSNTQSTEDRDPWLTVSQSATRAHCHPQTIRRLCKANQLRHARVGLGKKAIRIRASWLDQAIEAAAMPVEAR